MLNFAQQSFELGICELDLIGFISDFLHYYLYARSQNESINDENSGYFLATALEVERSLFFVPSVGV